MMRTKELMFTLFEKLEGINGIILIVYSMFAFLPLVYDVVTVYFHGNLKMGIVFAAGIIVGAFFACPWIIRKVRKLEFTFAERNNKSIQDRQRLLALTIAFFVISFGILFVWYVGYYPGFIYSDFKDKFDQAVSGNYNDWHPVLQTLLVYTIPLKLTGGWAGSVVLFQIIFFCCVLSYMGRVLTIYSNWKIGLATVLWIALSSITGPVSLTPVKDFTIAVFALLLMIFAARIYFSDGEWLNCMSHVIILSATVAVTTIVRHNGIMFTIPLFLGILFYAGRKKRIQLFLLTMILIFLVKGPLYAALHVESPGNRVENSVGLPMTIIGNAIATQPEKLDEDIKEFAYAVVPKEDWEHNYTRGSFNSVKWGDNTDLSVIEEKGRMAVLEMTWRCICQAPIACFESLIAVTKVAYALDESSRFYPMIIEFDKYEIPYAGNRQIASFLKAYTELIYGSVLKYVFCYVGLMNLIMVIFMLAKTRFNLWNDFRRLMLCIPVLTYDFGTLLFITGRDDRFFYISFTVFPVVCLIMLRKNEKYCIGNER